MKIAGEKLLLRLWNTVTEKGIGGFLKPWQIRRVGKALNESRRAEKLMLVQTEMDVKDIRAGRKQLVQGGALLLKPMPNSDQVYLSPQVESIDPAIPSIVSLANVSQGSRIAQAALEEINISRAILHAEEVLLNDPQIPPDRAIDDDWMYAWKDNASHVSVEQLQHLWGKILAGEIKAPGTFSLRTLDFLKKLSKSEAEKIQKLAQFRIGDFICRQVPSYLEEHGITLDFLLEMQGLGIISGVEAIGFTVQFASQATDRYHISLPSYGKILLFGHGDPSKKVNMLANPLTTIGKQILELGSFQPNDEFLRLAGIEFVKQGFIVTYGDWKQKSELKDECFNTELLKSDADIYA